jgi:hypothetical protein
MIQSEFILNRHFKIFTASFQGLGLLPRSNASLSLQDFRLLTLSNLFFSAHLLQQAEEINFEARLKF